MRRGVWIIAVALLVAAARGSADTTEDIVRRIQQRYDATVDFTAVVHQELALVSAGKTLSAEGSVAYLRPGRMRWEFQGPDRQLIVADGTTLWFYQPEEKQVLRAPFRAAFRSTAPVSFLIGVGRIADDFTATVESSDATSIVLSLLPKESSPEVGRLRLTIDARTYDILGAEVHDPLGNVTRLRFADLHRNTGLAESQFRFEVPSGVDVVDAPIGY